MKIRNALWGLLLWGNAVFGQGQLNFANSSQTLISVDAAPSPVLMPVSGMSQFIFAVFLAPSTTVTTPGQSVSIFDSAFQSPAAYTTNSASGAGRIVSRFNLSMDYYYPPGSTVDFVVRGWSANLGYTWAEFLQSYTLGNFSGLPWWGASTVGNDFFLGGGAIPALTLFGGGAQQVSGFMLYTIPEPTTSVLALAGLAFIRRFRRMKLQKSSTGI